MARTRLFDSLRQRLRALRASEGGNVLMTFALATIPLIGFVGSAVDYSRGNSAKASMQSALDATALMLSKEVQNLTTSQMEQKANDYFVALFNHPEVINIVVTPQLMSTETGGFKLFMSATAKVPTTFTKIIGQENMNLSMSTEVIWGVKKLELALALDVTGSMSSNNKMTELKKAAKNLLGTLQKAAIKDGDVKVAIVPFAVDVNVGTSNVNADWIRWNIWETKNGTCTKSSYKSKSSCTSNGGTWTPANHSAWNGCITDRDQDYDVQNTAPSTAITATQFPADQATACPASLLPLTFNWTTLNAKVDALAPSGNTNVTIGLAWGFHALTAAGPLNNASVPKPDLDKVIILLTDGQNTQNRWSTSTSQIDARTTKACNNVKAANIKIYTIRVIDGNTTLLQNCATKPAMFYNVQNASQLESVFATIAQQLANLRIAK
jgi:Flp pilus assembly protein TadG